MTATLVHLEKLSVLVFLVSSMLATGLTLTAQAMLAPLRDAQLVLRALVLNFVLAPALAWAITMVVPLDRGHAAGLLLLGCAAGAPFLPKVIESARGDLALAAALMGLLTVGTILFLPFALPWMVPSLHSAPWSIARPLVLLILLPFAVGMLVKHRTAAWAQRTAPVLAQIGNAALLLMSVLLVALNFAALRGLVGSNAIFAAVLFIAGLFAAGWFLGGESRGMRGALGLATAARNFGAALVPAASGLSDPKITLMIVVGALVCLVFCFLAAGRLRNNPAPRAEG